MTEYTNYPDNELQRLAAEGDAAAEETLIDRYARLVRICARPFFLAGGDSEDLTQEGMLGLLSAIRRFDPKGSTPFRTFAEVCIRNRIIGAVKSASRKKHDPLNDGVSLEYIILSKNQPSALCPSLRRSGVYLRNRSLPERAKESFIPRFHGACQNLRQKSFSTTLTA